MNANAAFLWDCSYLLNNNINQWFNILRTNNQRIFYKTKDGTAKSRLIE
jgi:hypothetical protein